MGNTSTSVHSLLWSWLGYVVEALRQKGIRCWLSWRRAITKKQAFHESIRNIYASRSLTPRIWSVHQSTASMSQELFSPQLRTGYLEDEWPLQGFSVGGVCTMWELTCLYPVSVTDNFPLVTGFLSRLVLTSSCVMVVLLAMAFRFSVAQSQPLPKGSTKVRGPHSQNVAQRFE